jgi:hypothetical protein
VLRHRTNVVGVMPESRSDVVHVEIGGRGGRGELLYLRWRGSGRCVVVVVMAAMRSVVEEEEDEGVRK